MKGRTVGQNYVGMILSHIDVILSHIDVILSHIDVILSHHTGNYVTHRCDNMYQTHIDTSYRVISIHRKMYLQELLYSELCKFFSLL